MKKGLWIAIIVSIIVLALAGGGLWYFIVQRSPKNVFLDSVDTAFAKIIKEYDEAKKYDSVKSKVEITAKIDSSNALLKNSEEFVTIKGLLEKAKLILTEEADYKNNLYKANLGANFDNQQLLNLDVALQNNKIYVAWLEVFNKYIEIPMEELTEEEITFESIDLDYDAIKEAIKAELKEQEFEKEKDTLKINGETEKVTKSTLKLSTKEFLKMTKNICSTLVENEDFIDSLGKYKETYKTFLEEVCDEIDYSIEDLDDDETTFTFAIYTTGLSNKFVKIELLLENSEYDEYVALSVLKEEEKYTINAYGNIDSDEKVEYANIVIEVKEEDDNKGIVTMEISIPPVEMTLTLNVAYEYEYNVDVSKVNNIITMEEVENLSEKELMEIYQKLQNTAIYKLLNNYGLIDEDELKTGMGLNTVNNTNKSLYEVSSINGEYKVAFNPSNTFKGSDGFYENTEYNSVEVNIDTYSTVEEYISETKNYLENFKRNSTYSDINISDLQEITVGDYNFKYLVLTYSYYTTKFKQAYYCCQIDENVIYTVETETLDEIPDSEIMNFLTIQVKKNAESENIF